MRLLLLGAFWRRLFAFCALRFALHFSALVALSWRAACLGMLPAVWGLLAPLLALGVFLGRGCGVLFALRSYGVVGPIDPLVLLCFRTIP